MPLSREDKRATVAGLPAAGFACVQEPSDWRANPLPLTWRIGTTEHRYRLWMFEVTHGGNRRSESEYRIQVTNGPTDELNPNGRTDLLLGFWREGGLLVGYDPAYLAHFLQRTREGARPSPSAQVDLSCLRRARTHGFARETKFTEVVGGQTPVVCFRPDYLPAYLARSADLLAERRTVDQVMSELGVRRPDLLAYCRQRGFNFPPQTIRRYFAALTCKPFVLLAGVSGTGKTKLAQLLAEYYTMTETAGRGRATTATPTMRSEAVYAGATLTPDPSRFAFVSVRPDWTDGRFLLGYFNPILNTYETTPTLRLLLRVSPRTHDCSRSRTLACSKPARCDAHARLQRVGS